MLHRRIDIQVLRGFAVFGVMLAHFGALVPGGFLGVDVFFVISGFVITLSVWSLQRREHSRRRFLAVFWRRRFFRLVPVLVVVLTATLFGASLSLPPSEFGDQVEMSVWSLFFVGNVGVEVLTQGDSKPMRLWAGVGFLLNQLGYPHCLATIPRLQGPGSFCWEF